jgi:hypothetical protein
MPNPVAVNDLSPISGSLQTSRISYAVETAGKDYGQDYNGTTWYSDIPQNGSQYTIISDNYTANYYVSRSNAEGAYVEGGLPAVDEYSAPVFWLTAGTSSLDIITIVNGLPDRIGQIPFNSGSQALNWIASSSNYFAVGPPYEQIDADELVLYLQGNQVISYPTTGSSWYDISGYGTNGTLINGPTFNSSLGTIFLDGVDDFVTCSITNIAPTTFNNQDITFEILCNTTTNDNAYHTLMSVSDPNHPSGNYAEITLGQWRNGLQSGSFYWQIDTTVQSYLIDSDNEYNSTEIATGKFFHVVGTWGKNGASYRGTLYVNGSQVAATNSAISTYTASNATKAYIGTDKYGSPRQGNINNSKIYSKALSAAEVAQNYYGGPIVTGSLVFAIDAGNLVSYPKSGTAVYTLTGSVNGTLTNGPTFNPTFDGCWNFDGTDDYILLGSSITPGNGNWTLSAWVRGFGGVVGNTSGGPVASGFGIFSTGGNYKIFYANYDGSWNYNYGNTTLNPNEWYFLTWVNYTGNTMKMYVNGVADSSVFNSLTSNGGPVDAVGGTQGTPGGTFNGNIASVQWNIGKAFTDAEVLQNYNATK